MAKGLTAQDAAQRLGQAGIAFGERYRKGVTGKGGRWVGAASIAGANFKTGMQEFLAKGDLGRSMSAAGAGAYDQGVTTKGVNNWGPGMQIGQDKYARKVGPAAALWNAPLSTPKGNRRSAANKQRMQENLARFEALRK